MTELAGIDLDKIDTLPPAKRKQVIAIVQELKSRQSQPTVVGFVDPQSGYTHSLKRTATGWEKTDSQDCDIYLPSKFERVLLTKARHIYLIGGRGSSKSISVGDLCLADAKDIGAKTFCLREYQSSIKDSVHALLCSEIDRLEMEGFDTTQNSITRGGAQVFSFAGISRNPSSVKSAFGFRTWFIEEAQFLSEESLEILMPSARKKPNKGLPGQFTEDAEESTENVRLMFVANLGSMEDPFTKRISEYLPHVEQHGYYEDDLRLIIKMNYSDNPWFAESGMEAERREDERNMPPALYKHIWEGDTNDHIDNALVLAEWFDACIDAHEKLGFAPRGVKIGAHDPADMGKDSKGYAYRHGSVVLNVDEKTDGNVNEGADWAADHALEDGVDHFSWDIIGMGAGLARQFSQKLEGKKVSITGFHSAESPDNPKAIYNPALKETVRDQLRNEDVFKNKRAQYAFELRDRIYRTYLAVTNPAEHGYQDPDTLISFSSKMPLLMKLRAEVCRIPRKHNRNGLNELYTKEEMKRVFKIPSPNLFDSVMILMRYQPPRVHRQSSRPPVIPAMRTRR